MKTMVDVDVVAGFRHDRSMVGKKGKNTNDFKDVGRGMEMKVQKDGVSLDDVVEGVVIMMMKDVDGNETLDSFDESKTTVGHVANECDTIVDGGFVGNSVESFGKADGNEDMTVV